MDGFSYQLETREQFWDELLEIVSGSFQSLGSVERAIVAFLKFVADYMDEFVLRDCDLVRCCSSLIQSTWFMANRDFASRKLARILLQNKLVISAKMRLLASAVLLLESRRHSEVVDILHEEKVCINLIDTVWYDDTCTKRFRRIILELLYELCRFRKLSKDQLKAIEPEFIEFLLWSVENHGDDNTGESYYEIEESEYNQPDSILEYDLAHIKIILALNEQYMIHCFSELDVIQSNPELNFDEINIKNMVCEVIAQHVRDLKTFSEDIVLLINRRGDPFLQQMILKLLYTLFTHAATFELFYTNDLRVMVDVFIRELYDLTEDEEKLKNMYLRVLYPLLLNTQLSHEPYKQAEIIAVLESVKGAKGGHFFIPISKVTQFLASRCLTVPWLEYLPSESLKTIQGEMLDDDIAMIYPISSLLGVCSIAPSSPVSEEDCNHLSIAKYDENRDDIELREPTLKPRRPPPKPLPRGSRRRMNDKITRSFKSSIL
ncbi:hypothetical protein NADFUDRAFT_49406 [Nadsonia fulvescens var. elongata DSM 6958]|uniref:SPIN90/Ldb17 leucine-rich domain-containing protein n=1 Tax=Nadsonia fulvescens var. elongata DSM 6958 TaxID=857566 RepID=A0A1E3PNF9_9ASCO|nr:hypothetical protein NADFUDRAFT_49406 [Nadsonia fulvescens var. elongata DSM 6958]